jgi:uncharacterized protein YcnI
MPRTSKALQLFSLAASLGVGLLVTAGSASAHVEVDNGAQPPKGGYGVVRLIVPTESATASTTGVTITLPKGVDLSEARTLPLPGWAATVETEPAGNGQRVSRISWQAVDPANGVKPTEFGEFTFSAGPWPTDGESVALPSDQTYSDGSVVSWNEIAVDKDTEPEHPAPAVTLGAAEATHSHADGGDDHAPAAAAVTTQAAAEVGSNDSWFWRITSVVSLVIALGTAAALAVALRRTRGTGS